MKLEIVNYENKDILITKKLYDHLKKCRDDIVEEIMSRVCDGLGFSDVEEHVTDYIEFENPYKTNKEDFFNNYDFIMYYENCVFYTEATLSEFEKMENLFNNIIQSSIIGYLREWFLYNYKARWDDPSMNEKRFVVRIGSLNWEDDEHYQIDDMDKYGEYYAKEIVIKNYIKEEWVARAEKHHVKLEWIIIDILKEAGYNINDYYYEKNNICKHIWEILENDTNEEYRDWNEIEGTRDWNGESYSGINSFEVVSSYDKEEAKHYISETIEFTT